MKTLLKIVGVLVALLLVALLAVYFSMNILIARAITSFGPALTQTPVKVTLVTMSPFSGGGQLMGLTVDSPKDYAAQPAIKLGEVKFKVNLGTLLSDKIVIEEISIDSPEVNFEQKFASNNISALRKNVNEYVAKFSGTSTKGARKFQINRLVITNGKAHLGTAGARVTFPIADTERTGIGAKADGVNSAEITRVVFSIFTDSVLKGVASGAIFKEGANTIGEGVKSLFGN